MSILQVKYDTKLLKTKKCIDEEYTVESRKASRMPPNFVQYWINTGCLPPQFHIDATVHSDIGSSLSEEESLHKQNAVCNTVLKYKLNDKQLCNNSSSNSSVDTAAYVLSNTNITKKDNINSRFIKKDGILKICKVMNHVNNKIYTAGNNICDTIDSNISNKTTAFDIHGSNEMYQKGVEGKNIIEEIGLKLPISYKENIDTMPKDDQISEDDLNCQNVKVVENSREGNSSEGLHNDAVRQIRQKKLYMGRESPIDINMSVVSNSVDNNVDEKKRNLHPAYRNSPLLHKPYRKCIPKKRKYNFFFKNSRDESEDSSSSKTTDDDMDVETRDAKRPKSLENPENNVDEITFFTKLSQTSERDKLRQSCKQMVKQIKRFPTSKFIRMNKLKRSNHDHISQSNITFIKGRLRRGYVLRQRKKIQRKTKKNINCTIVSCNTLKEKLNPIVLLERLSEKLIKRYMNKVDLQSENIRKNIRNVPIKSITKAKRKRNYRARSIMLKGRKPHLQIKNVVVDSGSSNASTIVIYNRKDSQSTSFYDRNDLATINLNSIPLPSSGTAKTNQLDKFSSDIKLVEMRPMVILKRLPDVESSKKGNLCKSNNLKNKWQPVVVLERLIDINRNSSRTRNLTTYKEDEKTEACSKQSGKTNSNRDHGCEQSKKLLCFKTKTCSDSDSDESPAELSFNLKTTMKYNMQNKTINQESINSLKINKPEDTEGKEDRKIRVSRVFTKKKELCKRRTWMHDHNLNTTMNNVSCIDKEDKPSDNFNKCTDNQRVHSLPNIKLQSTSSEKDKDTLKNNVKDAVIIDGNVKNKRNTLVFVTKAYDSDTD